jgi:hypothetical protein
LKLANRSNTMLHLEETERTEQTACGFNRRSADPAHQHAGLQ